MGYEKTHDGVMNNIESLTDSLYGLDFLDYSDTKEYQDMAHSIFIFLKAAEEKDFILVDEDD